MATMDFRWSGYPPLSPEVERYERQAYVASQIVPRGFTFYFRNEARFWAAHSSASIDGGGLAERQARLVMIQGHDDYPMALETENCLEAYEFVEHLAKEPTLKIDEGLVRVLNAILLRRLPGGGESQRGMYRKEGRVFQDPATRSVRYSAPPPRHVPALMESFIDFLNQTLSEDGPFYAAVVAHYGLISVQPFWDGNGRTGRLLGDLILNMHGLAADGMLSISSRLLDNRGRYYDVLSEVQGTDFKNQGSIRPFVQFSAEIANQSADVLEEKVLAFARVRDDLQNSAQGILEDRQVVGLFYMADLGPMPTAAYAKLNLCSIPMARNDLRQLVHADMIEQVGEGRQSRYGVKEPWASLIRGQATFLETSVEKELHVAEENE